MDYPDFPPKHPLADAIHQVIEAVLIASRHLRERRGQFTVQDMDMFDRLREAVWMQYFHATCILDDARQHFAKQTTVPPERPGSPKH